MVKIYPEGVTNVSTLAGSASKGDQDGEPTIAQFNRPIGVAVLKDGNVVMSDSVNNRIRKIAPDGQVRHHIIHGRCQHVLRDPYVTAVIKSLM
eukprot:1176075-Prorocentrum_minimum.AAC.2